MACPSNNPAANSIYSSLVDYNGINLFDNLASKGDNLNEVLCIIDDLFTEIFNKIDLTCIDLTAIGIAIIESGSSEELTTRLCDIINQIGDVIAEQNITIASLQEQIDECCNNTPVVDTFKVKVDGTDTEGFLETKLTSPQTGTIYKESGILKLRGFVPIGFVGFYSGINKFDVSGAGNAGTDAYGWQICNGNGGTEDLTDMFIKVTSTIAEIGDTGGVDEITIVAANISSFNMPVAGSIDNALTTHNHPVTIPTISNDTIEVDEVPGGEFDVLITTGTDGSVVINTGNTDLSHTHTTGGLTASHTNASPTPIVIEPIYIKLVAIQRVI